MVWKNVETFDQLVYFWCGGGGETYLKAAVSVTLSLRMSSL